jgi:hypothetical protein
MEQIQKNIKKQRHEKQRDEERTNPTLPIHDNVVLVGEGGENDGRRTRGAFHELLAKAPRLLSLIGFSHR